MRDTIKSLKVVDSFWLKLIALVTMTIDHAGVAFLPVLSDTGWYWPMRYIGRIAFPIYCFLLVEGFLHTRSQGNYLLRLLALFVISEPVYDLALNGVLPDWNNQNILLTLAIGLGTVWVEEEAGELLTRQNERLRSLALLVCLPGLALAELLYADYGYGGVLLILCFYLFRKQPGFLCVAVFVALYFAIGAIEVYGLIALVPILLYNGQRGRALRGPGMKYAFYAYYPAHIAVLLLLQRTVFTAGFAG